MRVVTRSTKNLPRVESIAVLGLIQPISVDSQEVLLACGHQREAIERLQATNPKAFAEHFGAGVPVRSYDFDAAEDPENSKGDTCPI
jgi:ParB family transcriptional regulator, chromosome partitioning protein